MAVKERIPLQEATMLAREVLTILGPFCERIEVLGSIRRGRPDVGDIEIGCIPKMGRQVDPQDMFAERKIDVNMQLREVKHRLAEDDHLWSHRLDKNGNRCCGEGVQRLLYRGFALDIFATTEPDAWGVLKLIRTGSGDFNKRVVLQKVQGGTVLPYGMRFEGGRLWDRGRIVPTPTEEAVFEAIGLAYVEPHRRDR